MRNVRLILALAITACQPALTASPPGAFQPVARNAMAPPSGGHLYVSFYSTTGGSTERFPLIKGVPQTTPDLVYRGYWGPIAVAGDGTLYVVGSAIAGDVVAFPPNSNTPNRDITFPKRWDRCFRASGASTEVSALAADTTGYLFAGVYTTPTLQRSSGRHDRRPKYPRICEGVAVYAPTANGKATPVQVVRYPRPHDLQSLAVDASDNLYVDDSTEEVDEFANAVVKPAKTRVFKGAYVGYAHSIATDEAGNLFIAGTDASYKSGHIDRYAPDADGYGPPTSTIVLPSGVHLLESIATKGRVLYDDDADESIDLYRSLKNGNQVPFYSLPVSNIVSVATGP